ncbi:MAG: M15 family metallopeptidase [Ignavibacteria bacterium]|nr:M15 family metallopeptidase [Ignavibacteria bacterium]
MRSFVIVVAIVTTVTVAMASYRADTLRCSADAYVIAYPEFIERVEGNDLVWRDGTRMAFDHGMRFTNHEEWLNNACLRDQILQCYWTDNAGEPPHFNHDPGRARYGPFFTKMYGASRTQVSSKLTTIIWMPGVINAKLQVTTVSGVDKKLLAVSKELALLPASYHKYLKRPGGTFNWRNIAGTSRISTHAFGITLDINVAESHYWRNAKPEKIGRYAFKNTIPMEIVKIFEKHGFVWGGRWYHYDTMHFEYRPELLVNKCSCQQ